MKKKLFLLSICFSCIITFAQKIPCQANWTKGMEFTYNIVRQQLMKVDMGMFGEEVGEEAFADLPSDDTLTFTLHLKVLNANTDGYRLEAKFDHKFDSVVKVNRKTSIPFPDYEKMHTLVYTTNTLGELKEIENIEEIATAYTSMLKTNIMLELATAKEEERAAVAEEGSDGYVEDDSTTYAIAELLFEMTKEKYLNSDFLFQEIYNELYLIHSLYGHTVSVKKATSYQRNTAKSQILDFNTTNDVLLTVKDLDTERKVCHLLESSKLNSKSLKNLSKELSKEMADMMDIFNEADYEYDYGTGVTQKVCSVQGVNMNYQGVQLMSFKILQDITLVR